MADITKKTVSIYIDSASAEDAFSRLQAKATSFSEKIQRCKDEQTKLLDKIKAGNAAGEDVTKLQTRYAELGNKINALNKSQADNAAAMAKVKDQIDKGLSPSFNQLQRYVTNLNNELKNMSQNAPGYAEKFDAFKKSATQLNALRESMSAVDKVQRNWMQEAKTVAFGVLIGNTVQSAAQAIGGYFSGIVSGNAKLSDSLSDVEKSTGLSAKSVAELNKQIGKIDTRTKAADLREIAVGLGQVGVEASKSNIAKVDQIVVALGDEFGGGAREITTALTVLRNNLKDVKTGNYGDDILHIGNALNVLGAEGLATAPVVTDIANRLSGIGQTYKLTSGQILGIAATFQELGIETERGSTAITKTFQRIAAEPEKFAKVAQMSTKEFKDLVNNNILGAFEAVSQGAKKLGSDNVTFSKILKELDSDGSGAGEVISKLADNADLLSNKIGTATTALKENGSILDEFTKKNTNLAAETSKFEKSFESIIQSKGLADFFAASIRGGTAFINMLKATPEWLKENQIAIYLVIAGLALMNTSYIKAGLSIAGNSLSLVYNTTISKAKAIVDALITASTSAYIVVTNLLTARITLATAAQRLWNIALSLGAGPIGAIIIAAGLLTVALGNVLGVTKTLSTEQRLQADLQKQVAEDTFTQKNSAQELLSVAQNINLEYGVRKRALDELIAQNPEYLKGLSLENITTQKGIDIINDYIDSLDRLSKAKNLKEIKDKLAKDRTSQDIGLAVDKTEADNQSGFSKFINAPFGTGAQNTYLKNVEENIKTTEKFNVATNLINEEVKKLNFSIDTQKEKIKGLKAGTDEYAAAQRSLSLLQKERNMYLGLPTDAGTTPPPAPTGKPTNPFGNPEEEKKAQAILEKLKQFKFELEQYGKQKDEAEIDRIKHKYDELMQEAIKHGIGLIGLEGEKNKAIRFLTEKEAAEKKKLAAKFQKEADEEYLTNTLNSVTESAIAQKEAKQKEFAAGIIDKKQLQAAERTIDLDALNFQIQILQSLADAEDVSVEVRKKAAQKLLEFKKLKSKEELSDAIKTREQIDEDNKKAQSLKNRDAIAKAQVSILTTQPNTQARLKAELALLEAERSQALGATDLTENEKARIKEEYRLKEADATKNFYLNQVNEVLNGISAGLNILDQFNQAKNNKEKAQLDAELKNNDKRRKSIESLQKNKVISEVESKKRLAEIDKEDEKRKEELERKQQARSKKIAIAQAIINGALAITATLAAIPGPLDLLSLTTGRYIAIATAIATTAAQVAVISSQKFADGGRVLPNGRINTAQNIPTQPNGDNVLATVKTGEVILNEVQQAALGGADTFRRIGVPGFASGGRVVPFWQSRQYVPLDYRSITQSQAVVRQFAVGGLVTTTQQTKQPEQVVVVQHDEETKTIMKAVLYHLQNPVAPQVNTSVSLKQLDDAYAQKARILLEATG